MSNDLLCSKILRVSFPVPLAPTRGLLSLFSTPQNALLGLLSTDYALVVSKWSSLARILNFLSWGTACSCLFTSKMLSISSSVCPIFSFFSTDFNLWVARYSLISCRLLIWRVGILYCVGCSHGGTFDTEFGSGVIFSAGFTFWSVGIGSPTI